MLRAIAPRLARHSLNHSPAIVVMRGGMHAGMPSSARQLPCDGAGHTHASSNSGTSLLRHAAATVMDNAHVLSQALGWAMWEWLGAEERRALRATCRQLCTSAEELLDTLVLHVVGDGVRCPAGAVRCSDSAAADEVAAFHRRCPAASTLLLTLYYDPAREEQHAIAFMAAYSAASHGSLATITACRLSVGECVVREREPYASLLLALPMMPQLGELQLGELQLGDGEEVYDHEELAAVLEALAHCSHLRALHIHIRGSGVWGEPHVAGVLARLTQLRTLSFTAALEPCHFSMLAALPQLECLGIEHISTDCYEEAQNALSLPSVHTLTAACTATIGTGGTYNTAHTHRGGNAAGRTRAC